MKRIKKKPVKTITKKTRTKVKEKIKKPSVKKMEDVQRLVHLLQVHQVELEHQNEELRIAQEELEVSRNKYVNLFDFSPTPYFTLNLQGVIKEVNLSASKMFGTERKKIIGRNFISYIPLDERDIFNSFLINVFENSVKQSCQTKVTNKEKRLFQVLLEGIKNEDPLEKDIKCQIAVIDVTEFKNIGNELKEKNQELKRINNIKDKFFSIIAHDLRSPFQALLNYSNLLATEIESLSQEEIVQFNKGLNEILNNVYNLLENLLNWSMMQRGMIEFMPVSIELNDVLNKTIEVVKHIAVEKNISISNRVESGNIVYADLNMLRSILQNLIMNAVKFTPNGGQVIITSANKNGFVEVSVKDNGIGINLEKSHDLFGFISLFTSEGTSGEKGTGLGLPLCKEFIEKIGGKIRVESELGKGSKFTFTLRKVIS